MNEASTWAARAVVRPGAPTFASVAERHLDDVYAFLVYLTGDRAAAEDLTGETFERAFRLWGRYDERRGSPRTWLCQIARTAAIDHLRSERRRRRREASYAREAPAADENAPADGFSPRLESALRRLSAADREVIALRVLLDLDAPAAARWLGISDKACSMRLSRALERLEQLLERGANDV